MIEEVRCRRPRQGSAVLGAFKWVMRANDSAMIKHVSASAIFCCALSIFFAGTIAAVPQSAAPERALLSTVNGAAFTSGPVTVDSAHCGWNYVLGGAAFYAAQ